MLTRHHVVLGLLCSFIPGSAIAETDPFLAILFITGCGIGLVLPDIHMKRPRTSRLRMVAWWIVQTGRWICLPVMCRVYRWRLTTVCEWNDKRLTHSIPGVFFYFSILSGIAYVPLFFFKNNIPAPMIMGFLGGLLTGMLLHLTEDLCTRKGITPVYPFDGTKIVGSIRPCDVLDNRILRYHIHHGTVLFFSWYSSLPHTGRYLNLLQSASRAWGYAFFQWCISQTSGSNVWKTGSRIWRRGSPHECRVQGKRYCRPKKSRILR
jgi:membrane-bound metal-dependent hydrolase YbcI (DUF457 family)